eukprot:scaffold3159_cov393-Prasinococcus_capsulatus_cf.AAC.7
MPVCFAMDGEDRAVSSLRPVALCLCVAAEASHQVVTMRASASEGARVPAQPCAHEFPARN